ncbi:MAG: chlorophyll synthase ChlG [Caulobacterales bacterium]
MASSIPLASVRTFPAPSAVLELFKPITWFAPMWAFMCGVVSSGVALETRWPMLVAGMLLAGPLICATSQAVNDWYDRHVDALNEPNRPIPSGRVPGAWGLYLAIIWTGLSAALAAALGPVVFVAGVIGLALAWAYSAPPLRLKRSGWWGPGAVALAYEGITWFTGAAVMSGGVPSAQSITLAALYAFGAHGIMTLNDFKAIEGDKAMGIRSLPVVLGPDRAARLACAIMAAPQIVVVALLAAWGHPWRALAVAGFLAAQAALMTRLLSDPRKHTPWYNATGTSLYVLGMLAAAFAIGSTGAPA